jgi:pyruvate dehydrogenase complex dehydrogenase (E1) component
MIALVGDAELDEGNIFEAMLEGWKQGLRNCWWGIDYNRQSLDAVVREGLWERYEHLFKNFRPPDVIDFSMTPNRRLSAVRCLETEFRWC